jgi:[acyl-carrier-protein] S-malonyltransferase
VGSDKIAFVFPGQGSQHVGMGKDLCRQFAAAKRTFAEADDVIGYPLSKLCFEGPEPELKRTENTQPAILTASIAALQVLQSETALRADFAAGHSLGEYSALVCAGALGFADALKLVRQRGRFMQEAVPEGEGGMAVILGLEMDNVRSLCAEVGGGEVLAPANDNGGGQIVIAGTKNAVARAVAAAKGRGAKRALDLPVSAPFHCELMRPAAKRLEAALASIVIHPLSLGVVTNVEADVNQDPNRVKWLLTEQAVRAVRWDESVRKLEMLGCRRIYEVGPGKVLTGLIKRISGSFVTENLATADDLAKVRREAVA